MVWVYTDAVILRSSLNWSQELQTQGNRMILASSDKRLLRAAKLEGIEVFDPEVATITELQMLL